MESLIAQIHKDKMNSICFDCGVENPKFVSINNGIFLCNKCATVHMSFPQGVSNIENNDLYSLSENELKFLAEGGNTSLNDFILDEFPKLENYSQKLLYKTRAMDYYRKRLYYYIFGGIEPKRPSSIVGCQLIPDNHYTKDNYERNNPKRFEPKTKTYRPEEHVKSTKYKDEFDDFFNDPFMNPDKFGDEHEKEMFKKFFGKDFFGMENDDFFNFDGKKNLNKTTYEPMPKTQYHYQERPKNQYNTNYNDRNRNTNNYSNNTYNNNTYNNNNYYNNNTYNVNEKEPMDNYSKRAGPYTSNYVYRSQRPSSSLASTVPSRKDKYMKRDVQNDNSDKKNNNNTEQVNQNVNRGGTVNPMKYMKSSYRTQYSKPDEKEKEAEREKEREREREEKEREREREKREREEKERERERQREERERERQRQREERERQRQKEREEREERERERQREKKEREQEKREKENQKENIKETQENRYNNNNNDNNNKKSYDPFKRRDSTDLITLPGVENSNLLQKNKKKQKPQEIPSEFSKQASGLGQIADAINENDNESISSQSDSDSNSISNSDNENNQNDNDFAEELKKIPEYNTHKKDENNNNGKEDDITFKNSIRNKYKKRKSQIELEKKQEEERLKARPINNNNTVYESKYSNSNNRRNERNENNNNDNIKKKPSRKNNEFKSKKSGGIHNDGANPQFNKSYARRLSKMNITSSNWNINQLGDINTYPEVIEVEELIFY